ncbi:DnaJ family molecular chaperone [Salinivibrio sp. ES.052]|uniref:J domain-containing protein n=1 Tax=Salinivibrio sp. ES.052 TaxID=1882823 RepID=UPI000928592D|nr:J domain-containing protein [Salinivibrio sp. ES.052]SIN79927.1 hypothetical protein SAMN05444724_0526 [Salinivibrio sp. ES.052]
MNPFEFFGLDESTNPEELKTKYKLKLRDNHPEDNPEGFKELREKYETALSFLEKEETLCNTDDIFSTVQNHSIDEFNETLNNIKLFLERGFSSDYEREWAKWVTHIELLPLDQSVPLSKELSLFVADRLWIPSFVISELWDLLNWSALYNGDRHDYQLASLLDNWRSIDHLLDISTIYSLPSITQKAMLSYYQSLALALHNTDINALNYIIHKDTVTQFDNFNIVYWLLRSIKALNYNHVAFSIDTHVWLISKALQENSLNTDRLMLLAEHCIYLKNEKYFLITIEKLASLKDNKELVINLLQLFYHNTDPTFTLWAVAIQRKNGWINQQYALSLAYPIYNLIPTNPTIDMLWDQIADEGFVPKVDIVFDRVTEQDHLASLWWHINYGAWHGLEKVVNSLRSREIESYRWSFLSTLLLDLAEKELECIPTHNIFSLLRTHYYSAEWFTYSEISQEDISAPTSSEWEGALIRHPILPKKLLDLLLDREDTKLFLSDKSDYFDAIAQQEIFEEKLSGKIQTTDNKDKTKWAEFYLFYQSFPKRYFKNIREVMSKFASPIRQSPLGMIYDIAFSNDMDLVERVLRDSSADVLCQREIYHQYTRSYNTSFLENDFKYISDERSTRQLIQACHHSITSRNIFEAAIIYKMVDIITRDNKNYIEINRILKQELANMPKFDEASSLLGVLHVLIYGSKPEIIQVCDDIQLHRTSKKSVEQDNQYLDYAYGMSYLLCFMETSADEIGFNTTQLEKINKNTHKNNKFTFSLFSHYAEKKLNQELKKNRDVKPRKFKWPGNKTLRLQALMVIVFSFFASSGDVGIYDSIIKPFMSANTIVVSPIFGFCMLLNLLLIRLIVGTSVVNKNRKMLGKWIAFWFIVFIATGAYWVCTPLWLTYLLASVKEGPSITAKGWPYSLKKSGSISFSDYI